MLIVKNNFTSIRLPTHRISISKSDVYKRRDQARKYPKTEVILMAYRLLGQRDAIKLTPTQTQLAIRTLFAMRVTKQQIYSARASLRKRKALTQHDRTAARTH